MTEAEHRSQPKSRFANRHTPPPTIPTDGDLAEALGEPPASDEEMLEKVIVDQALNKPGEIPWNMNMDEAPKNGKTVWVTPDGVVLQEGCWHSTRRFDAKKVMWVADAYWAIANCGGRPLGFQPIGWAKYI